MKFRPGYFVKSHANLLIGAGLMLASSGLDGVYMSLWMPANFPVLGFILNIVADVCDLYLSSQVGSLLRKKDAVKRYGAFLIFAGQLIAIGYSWLFSWRQLLRVLPAIEPDAYKWLAPLTAGFIPLLLAALGINDGLSSFSSKIFFAGSQDEQGQKQLQPATSQQPSLAILAEPFQCQHCEESFGSQSALNAHQRRHKRKLKRGNGHEQREKLTTS